jgi:hypothetical protein
MSFDGFVRDLRDGLVEGGRRRRRYERRRAVVLAATPVVLLLALIGGLVARDAEDATEVHTEVTTTAPSAAADACAVWADLTTGPLGTPELMVLFERYAPLATASGDPQLMAAAEQMAVASDLNPSIGAALERCDELGLLPPEIAAATTTTLPGTLTPSVVATCDAALDLWSGFSVLDVDASVAAYAQLATIAAASDDATFRSLGAELAAGEQEFRTHQEQVRTPAAPAWPTTTTLVQPPPPAYLRVINDVNRRCRFLRSPGWYADVVLAPLGPEPRVALEDYGTVTPLSDSVPTTEELGPYPSTAIGRELSPVAARIDGRGGILARWTYDGPTGASECRAIGATDGSLGSSCGSLSDVPAQHRNLATDNTIVAVEGLGDDVAFVVLDVGGTRYVQRPAVGMAILRADDAGDYEVLLYDADGNQLACSPSSGSTFAPSC